MKKIIFSLILLVFLVGCADPYTIEVDSFTTENLTEKESEPKSCAKLTFEKFNSTNESPEARTLARIMMLISLGSDEVDELEKLSQKELEIFLYHMECIRVK